MGKKQIPVVQETPIIQPEVQDYTPDKLQITKDLYQRDKDLLFSDERLYRQDSVNQRNTLGKFFDDISISYYKKMGVADDNLLKELRNKFIDDNISKLSLAKKKEEEEAKPLDIPDVLDKSQIYSRTYSKQDAIHPIRSDVDVNKAEQAYDAEKLSEQKVLNTIPKVFGAPEFNYIKSRPEDFLVAEGLGEKGKINNYLKGLDLTKEERQRTIDLLAVTAQSEFINNQRRTWDSAKLTEASKKAADPFITDAKPGTFIDPATGNRKLSPETDEDADQLALIKKFQKEILNTIIAGSPNNPLSKEKDRIDEEQLKLAEDYGKVEEKRKEVEKSAQKGGLEWTIKAEEWKKSQFEFIKKQKDLEQKIKDFNEKIDQDDSAITGDPTDKERLQQIVNDAYIMKDFWDKKWMDLNKGWSDENKWVTGGSISMGTAGMRPQYQVPLDNAARKKAEATAYFEAASRMAYNNEGPLDIKKNAKFQLEVLGDAIVNRMLDKANLVDMGKPTEQEVMRKMGEMGMREGITWTPNEIAHMQAGFLEHTMTFAGSLIPDLPGLIMIGGATNVLKDIPLVSRMRNGFKIIRNTATEGEKGITAEGIFKDRILNFDDPVPTGWKVIREAKPTAISKLKGTILASVIDEAAFTGILGMTPGFMTGMNTAHMFLPNISLKGKVGAMLQPYLDMFYKSAVGATVGMEAGSITSGMAKALFTDSTFKDEMNNLYPNLDDATKRVLAEFAVNGIFFGGMGALSKGSQKASTAPLGSKYGKYGGVNWTGYFNPVFRAKVFDAAKTADSKGYTDTARELYRWLDITKEPITGTELKNQRIAETEEMAKTMPIGVVRMAADANRAAIKKLEEINNDPDFNGFVTLQTRSIKDVKPMDVVEMDGRYYEVTDIKKGKKGNPIEFMLVDVETKEPTRALAEDVKADLSYRVGSRLEIALRLENHYEKLQTLNEVLTERGFYGKEAPQLKAGPPPSKGLGRPTKPFYVKPPEPTKIQKRIAQLQKEEIEMKEGGIEPIVLPEKLQKEYVYGVPEKIMETPIDEFHGNLIAANTMIDEQIASFDKRIEEQKKLLENTKFQGRLDLEKRRERQIIQDEITKLEFAKTKIEPKFKQELSNFWQDAKPIMKGLIYSRGEFTDEEVKEITDLVWSKISEPGKAEKGKTIGQIFDQVIQEYTGGKPLETPRKRLAEIDKLVEAEGYRFEIEPDVDPSMTTVAAFIGNEPQDIEELPKGIKDLWDEYTAIVHETDTKIEEEPSELVLNGKTFASKEDLFKYLDENFVDKETGIRKTDIIESGKLPEPNIIEAIKEWEKKYPVTAKPVPSTQLKYLWDKNTLIDKIKEYNALSNFQKQKNASLLNNIKLSAQKLDIVVKQKGRTISIETKEGKPVRKTPEKATTEQIENQKLLNEYEPDFQEFVNSVAITIPGELIKTVLIKGISPEQRVQGMRDVLAGKKSAASKSVLAELELMFKNGSLMVIDPDSGHIAHVQLKDIYEERQKITDKRLEELLPYEADKAFEEGLITKEERDAINEIIRRQTEEQRISDEGGDISGLLGAGKGPEEVKGAPEIKPKIDVSKDLKDMSDLLKLLGGPESGFGMEGGEDPGMKIKLTTMATGMVEKFVKASVYDFPTILSHIISQVDMNTMKKLLPYMRQGYGATYMNTTPDIEEKMAPNIDLVKRFQESDLDALIAEMNKPPAKDDYSDVIGKEFILPNKKKFSVIRIEYWDDPKDQKIELMEGGLFGTLPKAFEPILVAVTSDLTQHGLGKSGITLSVLREAIKQGKAIEVPKYIPDPERVKTLDAIADEFERLGDTDAARIFRAKGRTNPPVGRTLEEEMKEMEDFLKQRMLILKIQAGEVWFEKKPFIPIGENQYFAEIDSMHKGDPLEQYIRDNITPEQLESAIEFEQRRNAYLSMIGMTKDQIHDIDPLKNVFGGLSVKYNLMEIGRYAERLANGDKRAKPEIFERYKKQLAESLDNIPKNFEALKRFIFTWRVKYMLNSGEEIRDAGHLRKIAGDMGLSKNADIREMAELALVDLSNRIAQNRIMSVVDRYNRILSLYDIFPKLDVFATSDVKNLQQFSTPVPLAYLMGVYSNIDQVDSILDPEAGNGALFIGANKKGVRANEIDHNRAINLASQGYRTSNHDATQSLKDKFDVQFFNAIQTNPPFGLEASGIFPGGYKFKGTHFMVANALELLSPYGKSAILIGGHTEFDPQGRIKGSDLQFFNYLNQNFYVDDVINIPGDFYKKMGTSYPVRLILINGKKPAPEGFAPLKSEKDEPVASWNDLFERVQKLTTPPNDKSILRSKVDADGKLSADTRSGESKLPKNAEDIGPTAETKDTIPDDLTGRTGEGKTAPTGIIPGSTPRVETTGTGKPDNSQPPDVQPPRSTENPSLRKPVVGAGGIQPPGGTISIPPDQPGGPSEPDKRTANLAERKRDEVVPYISLSRVLGGSMLVPEAMANELQDALSQLRGEIGDIDTYVMGRLKYNSMEDLSAAFYAEQVDGIGMAVFNIENGDGTIIGDQTGVGKGRIAAGIISYAIENGYIPVFITKSADLFTSMYRDLIDIGRGDYVPFILNREFQGDVTRIFQPNSDEILYSWDKNHYQHVMNTQEMPPNTQVVLATYSQFNTDEGNALKRRNFLLNIASRAIFIMDESHEASGASNTGKFFKEFISNTKGGIFLSATFAKRPDNLPIYAMKTVMREANMTYDELVEAISSGGPALQEVISSQLSESIQFIRRQLNMEGIERNWYVLGDDDKESFFYDPELNKQLRKDYEGITTIMHEIIQFQRDHIRPIIEALDQKIKKEGEKAGLKKGTVDLGVTNTPYFSKVFNIIDQLLLAIKVKYAIPFIIDELKAGKKPFITLRNTMEAMITDLDLEFNMEIEPDFRYVLKRGLDGVMRYTVKGANGMDEHKSLNILDLSDMGSAAYKELNDKINKISTGITITPIDVLIKGITDAGFKVAEITGRHTRFELSADFKKGKYIPNRRPGKNALINAFNNEPGWAIVSSESGLTGLSAHSSPKFLDTSQRIGFKFQIQLDVNKEVQGDGRINRTDQVNKPAYITIITSLPAEKRLAMMNARKLKSLYANTTSNQKSSKAITEGTTDFLNKYGDEAVVEFLQENPDINNMMNKPIDLSKDSPDKDGAAHKVSGRVAVLPIDIQERFYNEVSDRYNAIIEYLNDTGTNDLEVTSEPLNAVTLSRETVIQGKGGISVFGDDTHLETVEVDILKKPLTKKEIEEVVRKVLEGRDVETYTNELLAKMDQSVTDILAKKLTELNTNYDAKIAAKRKESEGWEGPAADIQYRLEQEIAELEGKRNQFIGMYSDVKILVQNKLHRFIRFFYPGRVLDVPFKADDQLGLIRMNKGVFLGFDINMNKANPFTPSNIMLRFATADSRRMFRIPASKNEHVESIIANSYNISRSEQMDTLENWDKLKPSRNREKRFIVTGNILQGMAKYKGRLIEFTKQDGTVKKGILMPENWTNEDSGKIIIPAGKVYNIIRALAPMDFVESTSRNVQIQKDRDPYDSDEIHYFLKVPASRSRGEKYFGDKGLKELVYEGIFEVRGDWMVGRFNESNLMNVLNYLQARYGETFEVRADKIQHNESSQASALNIIHEFDRATKKVKGTGAVHPDREVKGSKGKADMSKRIQPEPIIGETPKKLWQIEKDFGDAVGQKIFWDRPASRRAAASYTPSLGKLVMKKMFMTQLDIAAHELGHRLDDMFGLVGPEAQPMFHVYQPELKELWQFGSKPPKGHPNPLQYQMAEGVAEYFRAFMVNPKETVRRYPQFSKWFEARVKTASPKIWDAMIQFGHDIRVFHGAKALDQIMANVKYNREGKQETPWGWTSLFKPTTKQGDFAITMFDVFAAKMINANRAIEKAYRWALAQSGKDLKDPKDVPPDENFIILSHLLLGSMDKIGDIFQNGMVNIKLDRIIDPITGKPISLPWKYESLPDYSIPEMEKFRQEALGYMVAERIVEAIWKFGAKQVRLDLENFDSMLPPLEILKKYPHIYAKYMPKILRIVDKIDKGELDPDKVWLPEDRYNFDSAMIIGVGQETFTDLNVAKKAIADLESIKESDPIKYKQYKEYGRRHRMISIHAIRYAHEGGLMSDKLYELITEEDLHYISLHRYFRETGPTDQEIQGFGEMFSVGRDSKGFEGKLHIHALKGSARPIVDPDLIQMEAIYSLVHNTDKNIALRNWVLAFTGTREHYAGEPQQIADIGYIVKGPGAHTIKFYVAGTSMYFKIQDPHVYRGIMQLGNSPVLTKWVTALPRILRSAITHSPAFAIRNMMRDFMNTMMISNTKPIVLKSAISGKDLDLAGMGQFGYHIRDKISYYRMQREWMFKHSKDPKKYFMSFKTLVETNWDKLEHFMSYSEKSVRLLAAKATYNKLVAGGMDPYEALLQSAFEARDLLDFHVAGEWMKTITQVIPFSNAGIQGMAKLMRSVRDNPKKVLTWWAFIAVLPSIANSIMISMLDDDTIDEYKQLPPYQRDMFFNIPLGNGHWLTIPKPFELGFLSSGIQRIFDKHVLGDDAGINEDWFKLGYNMLFPFDFAGITGGFAGVVHALTNRDFFRNKWIIPPDEVDISIVARNTERATKLGQMLQEGSRVFSRKGEPTLDARKIDDFIQSQIPYYGSYFLKASEAISGGAKQRSMKFDWTDLGIVKASPVYNAEDVQWVLKTAKRYKLQNVTDMDVLNSLIRVYFSEEVQADESKIIAAGKQVRDCATIIRKKWDLPEVNFAKMYEEAQEIKKLK